MAPRVRARGRGQVDFDVGRLRHDQRPEGQRVWRDGRQQRAGHARRDHRAARAQRVRGRAGRRRDDQAVCLRRRRRQVIGRPRSSTALHDCLPRRTLHGSRSAGGQTARRVAGWLADLIHQRCKISEGAWRVCGHLRTVLLDPANPARAPEGHTHSSPQMQQHSAGLQVQL